MNDMDRVRRTKLQGYIQGIRDVARFFRERQSCHNPNFHARYQEQEVLVEIEAGIIQGKMSRRALQMIFEWAEKYQQELLKNWELARERKPLLSIPPLT